MSPSAVPDICVSSGPVLIVGFYFFPPHCESYFSAASLNQASLNAW